jgi:hypothetical protein
MNDERGRGGGIRIGYDSVATFAEWSLSEIGPRLYRLRARCANVADGLLSLPGCVAYVPRGGGVQYEWDFDRPVPFADDWVDAVVDSPRVARPDRQEDD